MATLDQLPAEQRAIVELVVQRGRSYDSLADVLQVPESRVRELARDALTELSPRTASRVDDEWRGRVADYLLGQQSGAEARDTRGYLKRSESARAWALSLLDSLDPLYGDGGAPAVPEPPEEEDDAPAAAVPAAKPTAEEKARARARQREPERERERRPAREREREREPEPERVRRPRRMDEEDERPRRRDSLSPAAQAALRRRRLIGGAIALVVLAAVIVGILALAGVFSSDDDKGSKSAGKGGTSTTATGNQDLKVLGQIGLSPVGKGMKAQGIAYLVEQGGKRYVVVQAKVPPLPGNQKVAAYEVWLYNSNSDARSLGAQYTDAKGILQGRAPLPNDFARFKSIDVSRELFADNNTGHGNSSILRGAFANIQEVPQQQQQGGTGGQGAPPGGQGAAPGGTPTTPSP